MATKLNSFAVVHSFRATVIQTQRWKRGYDMLSHAEALSKFRHCILVLAHRIQTCGLRAKVGGSHRLPSHRKAVHALERIHRCTLRSDRGALPARARPGGSG